MSLSLIIVGFLLLCVLFFRKKQKREKLFHFKSDIEIGDEDSYSPALDAAFKGTWAIFLVIVLVPLVSFIILMLVPWGVFS